MNDVALKNNTAPKFKAAVLTFSIIALVAQFLVYIIELFNERLGLIVQALKSFESRAPMDNWFKAWASVITSDMLFTLFAFMVIYAAVIHKRTVANKIVFVICIISVFINFFGFIINASLSSVGVSYLMNVLTAMILDILAAIGAVGGRKTKILFIVAVSLILLLDLYNSFLYLEILPHLHLFSAFRIVFQLFALHFFDLALLFAGLGCSNDTEKPRELSTEEKLKILKQNLAQGTISFEEYTRQRSEIIGRL